jgi:transaldolase
MGMKIWLETNNLSLIEKASKQGLLYGVVASFQDNFKNHLNSILSIQKGPVIVDIYGEISSLPSPRIIPRLPAVQEMWQTLYNLSQSYPTAAGAIFNPTQALLAAQAGARYVCPHLSRMLKSGDRPFEALESIQKILLHTKLPAEMVVVHPKSLEQFKACAEIGAAGVIVRDDFYPDLIETPELAAFFVEQNQEMWKKSVEFFSETN